MEKLKKLKKPTETYPVKIEYFLEGRSLGFTYIERGSTQTTRYVTALLLDMHPFDRFILDDGRIEAEMVDLAEFDPKTGFESVDKGVKQYWNVKTDKDG